jgi:hypothetical protein
MVRLLHKHTIERANATLLLGVIWGGLAGCVIAALVHDIAGWLRNW